MTKEVQAVVRAGRAVADHDGEFGDGEGRAERMSALRAALSDLETVGTSVEMTAPQEICEACRALAEAISALRNCAAAFRDKGLTAHAEQADADANCAEIDAAIAHPATEAGDNAPSGVSVCARCGYLEAGSNAYLPFNKDLCWNRVNPSTKCRPGRLSEYQVFTPADVSVSR